MRMGDFIWLLGLGAVAALLMVPATHQAFLAATRAHPFWVGFWKFAILATMGELLARRILSGAWGMPAALPQRALVWGLLGLAIVLAFEVYAGGVKEAMARGLLPGGSSRLAFAFQVSVILNLTFAPAMMLTHRLTDTYLDLEGRGRGPGAVTAAIDWDNFVGFVLFRTIPIFWIPAHTVTFLLPPAYRVLSAALLSIALGAILAFAKRRPGPRLAGPR